MSELLLTDGLDAVLGIFEPHKDLADDEALELGADAVLTLVATLRGLRKMAHLMEQELAVHRADENNRVTTREMEAAATETLQDLVTGLVHDPEGRVVFGRFGRKS